MSHEHISSFFKIVYPCLKMVDADQLPFTLSHQHDESVLTIFVLDTGKQVPKQTVKTQMKCHMVAFHLGLHCLLK